MASEFNSKVSFFYNEWLFGFLGKSHWFRMSLVGRHKQKFLRECTRYRAVSRFRLNCFRVSFGIFEIIPHFNNAITKKNANVDLFFSCTNMFRSSSAEYKEYQLATQKEYSHLDETTYKSTRLRVSWKCIVYIKKKNDWVGFSNTFRILIPLDFRNILANTSNLFGFVHLRTTGRGGTSKYQTRNYWIEKLNVISPYNGASQLSHTKICKRTGQTISVERERETEIEKKE